MNRSPALAGVLSVLFPGLGHFYAAAPGRALALAAAFVALFQAANRTDAGLFVLGLLVVWLFGIVDAVRVTEETIRARAQGRAKRVGLDRRWAVGLVIVGVFATLPLIPGVSWAVRLWPIVLVWIGIQLLRGRPIVPGLPDPASGAGSSTAAPPATEPAADAPLAEDDAGTPETGKE